MKRLAGRTAVVTGGASGFGAGIVRRFAEEGARVAIVDLNLEAAQALAAEVGAGALAHRAADADGAAVAEQAGRGGAAQGAGVGVV